MLSGKTLNLTPCHERVKYFVITDYGTVASHLGVSKVKKEKERLHQCAFHVLFSSLKQS